MNSPLLSLLGLARRAGKIVIGFESLKESFESGKVYLAVCAQDISPKTFKEVNFFAEKSKNDQLSVIKLEQNRDEISNAIGTSAATLGICDQGFAKKILQLHNSGGNL